MKQLLQNLKTGEVYTANIPRPIVTKKSILIKTHSSLISAGTERSLLEFGRASLIGKAQQQPEKVKQVLYKIKQEGLIPTLETVFSRLDEPMPLGYSSMGTVIDVGEDVTQFQINDRVVSNGPHVEFACVPQNLCAHVPLNVTDEEAAFTILGSIALQGIRLLETTIGEVIVVVGLGLIGQLTAQILQNSGVSVLGVDKDKNRTQLAESLGIKTLHLNNDTNVVKYAIEMSHGVGVDGVIITATTKSNQPIIESAEMCRQRGRIVLIGVVGLNIPRHLFYEKELSFQVSCSYGPGRYDKEYEEKGYDYPLAYVRWTENRNFQTILQLISQKKLKIQPLISHRFLLEEAKNAYDKILNEEDSLGIILQYSAQNSNSEKIVFKSNLKQKEKEKITIGIIGAGLFTKRTLLPILQKQKTCIVAIASQKGTNASYLANKHKMKYATSNYEILLKDEDINTIFITTRHDLHAKLIQECLHHKKHIFVEKPPCLNKEELKKISIMYQKHNELSLMVGFNRRFAPHILKISQLLTSENKPLCFNLTINSGCLPKDHWLRDPEIGGGRIIGEGCHFIDLLVHLAKSNVTSVYAIKTKLKEDNVSIQLKFANNSIGSIHYWSNGHKSYPKEMLNIYCNDKILALNNFKKLHAYGFSSFQKYNLWNQDKGHFNEIKTFLNCIEEKKDCIPFREIHHVMEITFAVMESLISGNVISL